MSAAGYGLGGTVSQLAGDLRDLIAYLDNHGRQRSSAVSLSRALAESADILAAIKVKSVLLWNCEVIFPFF